MAFAITRVRYDEAEAQGVLRDYIFGGHLNTDRPPRGVDPTHVVEFVVKQVPVGADGDVYFKVLQALRFYEGVDAVPHLLQALDLPVEGARGIHRGCYAVQIGADIGRPTPELGQRLVSYFDKEIVGHDDAPKHWGLLMQTREVLTPWGDDAALVKRLADVVDEARKHEGDSEEAMMAFDTVDAVQRNDLPRMQRRSKAKAALSETAADVRRSELVETYLGRRHLGEIVEDWSARLLRREVIEGAPDPVLAAFAQAIDNTDRGQPQALVDLQVFRAAQAIVYLDGTLSPGHEAQYRAASGVANFLSDV